MSTQMDFDVMMVYLDAGVSDEIFRMQRIKKSLKDGILRDFCTQLHDSLPENTKMRVEIDKDIDIYVELREDENWRINIVLNNVGVTYKDNLAKRTPPDRWMKQWVEVRHINVHYGEIER